MGKYAETRIQLKQLLILALFLGCGCAWHLPFPFGWSETREHMFSSLGRPAQSLGGRQSVRKLSPSSSSWRLRQTAWPGQRRLGWGCPRFNYKIFSDVNLAISLNRFFKCVYGMGGV